MFGRLAMEKINKLLILLFTFIFTFHFFGFSVENNKETVGQELSKKYKKWLEEEVIYLISQKEKDVFKSMRTDEERDGFVKTFWKRRDPTPETPFNEYREEHYRRIEYANKNFFEGRIGWRTDRGRVYIMFGPPDFMETNPGGGRGFLFDLSGPTAEFPSEVWVYRHIPGLKTRIGRVELTFVNYYNSGGYRLVSNPALANALRNISVQAREVGYEDPTVGIPGGKDKDLPVNPLEQLTLMAELFKPRGEVLEELERSARLRKLKGIVDAQESLTELSFASKVSYVMGNNDLTHIPISIEVAAKDLTFEEKEGKYRGRVNFYIELKDKAGTVCKKSDRLEMSLREETYKRRFTDYYQYKHRVQLKPGEYFLHLVVWDEYSGNVGYIDKRIEVPQFSDNVFGLSDIILARSIRVIEIKKEKIVLELKNSPALQSLEKTKLKVPKKIKIEPRQVEPFTFGNLEINPNVLAEYTKNDELVFFYQIYNPTFNIAQKMTKLLIVHQIWKNRTLIATIDKPQEVHIPIEQKTVGLNSGARYDSSNLSPGKYTLLVRVKDIFSDKIIEKKIDFKVK